LFQALGIGFLARAGLLGSRFGRLLLGSRLSLQASLGRLASLRRRCKGLPMSALGGCLGVFPNPILPLLLGPLRGCCGCGTLLRCPLGRCPLGRRPLGRLLAPPCLGLCLPSRPQGCTSALALAHSATEKAC
jgi:hypothetical protein